MANTFKIHDTPDNDLNGYVGEIEYKPHEKTYSTHVDLKLLKRAILWIQSREPEAASLEVSIYHISPHNSLLVLQTKKQKEMSERHGRVFAYAVAPLTTHVEKAERFDDVPMKEFVQTNENTTYTNVKERMDALLDGVEVGGVK